MWDSRIAVGSSEVGWDERETGGQHVPIPDAIVFKSVFFEANPEQIAAVLIVGRIFESQGLDVDEELSELRRKTGAQHFGSEASLTLSNRLSSLVPRHFQTLPW